MGIKEELDDAFKDNIRTASPAQKIILFKMQAIDDQIDAAVRDGNEALMLSLHDKQMELLKMLTDLYWQDSQEEGYGK